MGLGNKVAHYISGQKQGGVPSERHSKLGTQVLLGERKGPTKHLK